MVPKLRPYQQDGLAGIRAAFGQGFRSVLYQAPTGAGKTVIFAHITRGAARKGNNVLLLVHRKELVDQGSRALASLEVEHGIISPRFYPRDSHVQVASVQTLVRRLDKIRFRPQLIVVDEAHHAAAGTWEKILAHFADAKVLGVTATPERLDGKGLNQQFERLILGPKVSDLIEQGYLSDFSIFAAEHPPNLQGIKTRMGDYATNEVAEEMERSVIVGDAVEHYEEYANGLRAIAFCCTVHHAEVVTQKFREAGHPSEVLDGSLSDAERNARLERFENGDTKVLTSCMIVSEGFDLPSVGCAILLRPTKSLALYLQQIGRALRPHPDKHEAIILDHAGNVYQHGLPTDDYIWSLEGRKKRTVAGRDPLTHCERCFHVYKPPRNPCPECGHIHDTDARVGPEEVEGKLKKIDRKTFTRAERQAYWREVNSCQTIDELRAFGRKMGYKKGWEHHIMKARRERESKNASA